MNGFIIFVVYFKQLYFSCSLDSHHWAGNFWFHIVIFISFLTVVESDLQQKALFLLVGQNILVVCTSILFGCNWYLKSYNEIIYFLQNICMIFYMLHFICCFSQATEKELLNSQQI